MPVYEFQCPECGETFDRTLRLANRNDPQECKCGAQASKQISAVGFILKGGGWPGKAMKVNRQMATRQNKLAKRFDAKKREEPGMTLVPNVNGEQTESWSDAKKLAADKGKDTSSYDKMVRKEKVK